MIAACIAGLKIRYADFLSGVFERPPFCDYVDTWDDIDNEDIIDLSNVSELIKYSSNEKYRDNNELIALALLSERLPEHDRILMHGVAVSFRGKAFIFTAPSGVGKSTHATLWKRFFKKEVVVLNGDKPIIALDKAKNEQQSSPCIRVYGTPWAGKEGWQTAASAPLTAICLIRRSASNCITRVCPDTVLDDLMAQFYIPNSTEGVEKTLTIIRTIIEKTPVFVLECDVSIEALKVSYEGLTGLVFEGQLNSK